MANLSQQGGTIEIDGTIPNNIAARAFRMSTENKNLLSAKGAMYVGTGEFKNVTVTTSTNDSVTYKIYETVAIEPPEADGTYVLQCTVEGGVVTELPHWVVKKS